MPAGAQETPQPPAPRSKQPHSARRATSASKWTDVVLVEMSPVGHVSCGTRRRSRNCGLRNCSGGSTRVLKAMVSCSSSHTDRRFVLDKERRGRAEDPVARYVARSVATATELEHSTPIGCVMPDGRGRLAYSLGMPLLSPNAWSPLSSIPPPDVRGSFRADFLLIRDAVCRRKKSNWQRWKGSSRCST
jgi:hypothetical protein